MNEKNSTVSAALQRAFILVATGVFASAAYSAADFGLNAGLGLEHHSNAARTSDDEKADTARVAFANVSWQDATTPVNGNIRYQIERRDFVDNVDSDQTSVNGQANLKWDAVPRLLDVIVQQYSSNTQTSAQTATTYKNSEQRNVYIGGVDGYLHLSGVDALRLSPRYVEVKFSDSTQSDSHRAGADLNWQHLLNSVSSFDLTGNYSQVKFDDSVQNYDSSSIETSYQTHLARLNYTLAAGYIWMRRDELPDDNGYSLRLAGEYRGDSSEYGLSYARQLTDTSIGLSQQAFSITNFVPGDSNFNQVDLVLRSQADLYARWHTSASTVLSASVGSLKDDYKLTLQDQREYYGLLGASHTINSYWSVDLSARYSNQKFLDSPTGETFKDTTLAAGANYLFNPRFSMRLQLSREERKADLAASEYSDQVGIVSFNYRFY